MGARHMAREGHNPAGPLLPFCPPLQEFEKRGRKRHVVVTRADGCSLCSHATLFLIFFANFVGGEIERYIQEHFFFHNMNHLLIDRIGREKILPRDGGQSGSFEFAG